MVPVKRRDAHTLQSVIKRYVKRFTTIYTDSWLGYNGLNFMGRGYNHFVVNHKIFFVHPVTGVHTNQIEASWRAIRALVKKVGVKNDSVGAYVTRYMLVLDAKLEKKDVFKSLLRVIGENQYPIPHYDDKYYSDYDSD